MTSSARSRIEGGRAIAAGMTAFMNECEPQSLPGRQVGDRPRLRLVGEAQVSDEGKGRCPLAKVLADRISPPARFGWHVADQAPPFRSREDRAVSAVERHQTL